MFAHLLIKYALVRQCIGEYTSFTTVYTVPASFVLKKVRQLFHNKMMTPPLHHHPL